jgi:hypothetical protein
MKPSRISFSARFLGDRARPESAGSNGQSSGRLGSVKGCLACQSSENKAEISGDPIDRHTYSSRNDQCLNPKTRYIKCPEIYPVFAQFRPPVEFAARYASTERRFVKPITALERTTRRHFIHATYLQDPGADPRSLRNPIVKVETFRVSGTSSVHIFCQGKDCKSVVGF